MCSVPGVPRLAFFPGFSKVSLSDSLTAYHGASSCLGTRAQLINHHVPRMSRFGLEDDLKRGPLDLSACPAILVCWRTRVPPLFTSQSLGTETRMLRAVLTQTRCVMSLWPHRISPKLKWPAWFSFKFLLSLLTAFCCCWWPALPELLDYNSL